MALLGPALGGLLVATCLTIPASLESWSPTAAYGIALVSLVTAAVLFVFIDRRQEAAAARRSPPDPGHAAAQDEGDC
jgi:hypothetical protein